MQTKSIDGYISDYLRELKLALSNQDVALVQDALYDAEEHLRAALEFESNPLSAFQKICSDYGSPQEVAEFYCEMESTVNIALNGIKKPVGSTQKNRFFVILRDSSAYQAMLYMILALPLGLFYFGWIMIAGLGSFASAIFIVGIPVFILFLNSMPLFSLFEGRLIEVLLNQRMPRRPLYQKTYEYTNKSQEWSTKLRQLLKNKRNWMTALYLLLRGPIGIASFLIVVSSALFSLALMISPIVDPILHTINPKNTIDLDWYWLPLALPGGFIGFVLSLHLAKFFGQFQVWIAKYLLLSTITDD